MLNNKNRITANNIEKLLTDKTPYKRGSLFHVANHILRKKSDIEKLIDRNKTPFYVFDEQALDSSIEYFFRSFRKEIPSFRAYYAIKINHHPLIVRRAVEKGMGLDVGSPREIDIAINTDINFNSITATSGEEDQRLKPDAKYPPHFWQRLGFYA